MSWRNGRPRMWRLLASSVTAIGLTLLVLNPTVANAATAQVDKPRASLTASWWEKFFELSDKNSFERCDVGTPKIVFLAGTTTSESATRSCTTDKNIFLVPLINLFYSGRQVHYVCRATRMREACRRRLHRSQACCRRPSGE
jgi:hypothetical protein